MNKFILSLTAVGTLTFTLLGCGGGGDNTTAPETIAPETTKPDPTEVTTSADIKVDPGFDFRIDTDMILNITELPQSTGVINVYYDYEFYDEGINVYYPDYTTRILSFYPSATSIVDIQVNKNWKFLIVEFVPTEARGIQMFKKLTLPDDSTIYFKFSE